MSASRTGCTATRGYRRARHHAVLYVNGDLYGLMVLLDTVDDVFLERWFDDPSGPMWEQHDGDFTDEFVQDNTYFQHEEGEDDRTVLQNLADALEGSGAAAVAAADPYLDWDGFHRYWAAGSVVMNFDAYPFRFAGDDCHVYQDPATGKLVYIPHGVDESFYYPDESIEERARGHVAASAARTAPVGTRGRARSTSSTRWRRRISLPTPRVAEQIEPWVSEDPNRNYRVSASFRQQDMVENIENLDRHQSMIEIGRRNDLAAIVDRLERPPPAPLGSAQPRLRARRRGCVLPELVHPPGAGRGGGWRRGRGVGSRGEPPARGGPVDPQRWG